MQRMSITLNQAAIEAALVSHIAAMGVNIVGKATEVSLTAGRKENGYTAEVTIITPSNNNITSATVVSPSIELTRSVEDQPPFETQGIIEEEEVASEEETELPQEQETPPKSGKRALFGN